MKKFISVFRFVLPMFLLVGLLFANTPSAFAASAGPRTGSTFTGNSGAGTISWTIPASSLITNDTNYATASLDASQATHYLLASGFGFTIPTGATIDGIQVTVRRFESGSTDRVYDNHVYLMKTGTIGGTDLKKTTAWGQTEQDITYGSSTEKWGQTWTAEDINNSTTGLAFSAIKDSDNNSRTASVDYVSMTVYYTLIDTTAPTVSGVTSSTAN